MAQDDERLAMIRDGLLAPRAIFCVGCIKPIAAGERTLCDDGYLRVYGEFVLSRKGEEPNWPRTHEHCIA